MTQRLFENIKNKIYFLFVTGNRGTACIKDMSLAERDDGETPAAVEDGNRHHEETAARKRHHGTRCPT